MYDILTPIGHQNFSMLYGGEKFFIFSQWCSNHHEIILQILRSRQAV